MLASEEALCIIGAIYDVFCRKLRNRQHERQRTAPKYLSGFPGQPTLNRPIHS
jgi:hypothetical protein